jgi:hypothetical protein
LPDVVDDGRLDFAMVRSAAVGVRVIVGVDVIVGIAVFVDVGTPVFVGTAVFVDGTVVLVGMNVFVGIAVLVTATAVFVRVAVAEEVTVGLDGVTVFVRVLVGPAVPVGIARPTRSELPGKPHWRLDAPSEALFASSGITTAQIRPPVPGSGGLVVSWPGTAGWGTTCTPSVPRLYTR